MFYRAEKGNLDVAVTGDSLITRRLSGYDEEDFLQLRDMIDEAEVAFTNIEVVLGEAPDYPAEHAGGNWLGVDPRLVDELIWMGFNLFSVANNHGGDFGPGGMLSTLHEVRSRNLAYAGGGETLTRARQPGYLDAPSARVGLVAASSTLPAGHAAGEQRQDMPGRPGVNPLRFWAEYRLPPEEFLQLKAIARTVLLEQSRSDEIKHGDRPDAEGEYRFLGAKFVLSEQGGMTTHPNERDLAEITAWIQDAKRQADMCFVSLHAHESHVELTRPAHFVETFCRAAIDAGADGVFGHGSHVLRGIEVYQGCPILYSLGNFMMQSSTMRRVPVDMYRMYDVDPFDSTVADIFDQRQDQETLRQDPIYYESALVRLSYSGKKLTALRIHPIHLGVASPRPQQGRPLLAQGAMAAKILGDLKRLSAPYGTIIDRDGDTGYVRLA